MTTEQREEITKISQEFAREFEATIGPINGSTWLIVDPLSGYLNACGYGNELVQIEAREGSPQVLLMVFRDGTQFIPAGDDLKPLNADFHNWMWVLE